MLFSFRRIWLAALLGALSVLPLHAARAASLPASFEERLLASGLSNPTAMQFAPDGRLFICEQSGTIRVVKNGEKLATPFVSLSVNSLGERGLLGLAFDPNFASNQYIYLYYTATTPAIHNRVSRFTANGDVALAGSETILLELDNLSGATNHNGGSMHFGPDGRLFIAVGENASPSNAQSLNNLLGKMLRINRDGSIPTDNPFYNTATGKNRAIWTLGLRNPFTFDIERGTGRMFINDVGQNTFEEINQGIAGANYGWPTTEGATNDPRFRSPLLSYTHENDGDGGCAITGGAFYTAPEVPFPSSYRGKYFYADYCSGWIRTFDSATGTSAPFAQNISAPVDLKVDVQGRLNYLARGQGRVYQVVYSPSATPRITSQPQNVAVAVGQTATFSVQVAGDAPFTYQWQRNGENIPGANAAAYSFVAQDGDGGAIFRVVVSNTYGTVTSNDATLSISENTAPVPTISSPAVGANYNAGDIIAFSGDATDAEDGALPASAFRWNVMFHHATHTHPVQADVVGAKSGAFTIPTEGETATNVFYRITLTVTDSNGTSTSISRDILPRIAQLQLRTVPANLQITLDGQPLRAPQNINSVVGTEREIGAPTQTRDGVTYVFDSWTDGGTATHIVSTPAANTVYLANFRVLSDARPLVSVSTPANGAALRALPAIRGTARPFNRSVNLVRVDLYLQRLSDRKFWNGSTWTTSTPLSTTINGTDWVRNTDLPSGANLVSGNYFLAARAIDSAGNGRSAEINFTVDTNAPTVSIASPAIGSTVSSFASASGTTSDNGGSGVVRVEFFLHRRADGKWWNGSAWIVGGVPLATTLAPISGGQSWSISSLLPKGANLTDGTYLIGATAIDRAGNSRNVNGNITLRRTGSVASPSPIQLSAATAKSDGTIRLTFTGALNATATNAANYAVTSDDGAVAINNVSQPDVSTVDIAAGALAAGTRVSIAYSIEDTQGRAVSGTATVVVK